MEASSLVISKDRARSLFTLTVVLKKKKFTAREHDHEIFGIQLTEAEWLIFKCMEKKFVIDVHNVNLMSILLDCSVEMNH